MFCHENFRTEELKAHHRLNAPGSGIITYKYGGHLGWGSKLEFS